MKDVDIRRIDMLFKLIYTNYKGALIDVNCVVPLLCFQHNLLSINEDNEDNKDTVIIDEKIKEFVVLDEYGHIESYNDEGWSLATKNKDSGKLEIPFKKYNILTANNDIMQAIKSQKKIMIPVYTKIHCITDLESDDLLALKLLAPYFNKMEVHLCQDPRFPDFTSFVKDTILKNKPNNVTINTEFITDTFINLNEIANNHYTPQCFQEIYTKFPNLEEMNTNIKQKLAELAKQVKGVAPLIGGNKRRKSRKHNKRRKSRKTKRRKSRN